MHLLGKKYHTTNENRYITFKRVKNLGNYENETFQATATIEEGDDPEVESKRLMSFVIGQLYGEAPKPTADQVQEIDNF